jgi:leucyl/phenylalanyl-tRNA--protein transferase
MAGVSRPAPPERLDPDLVLRAYAMSVFPMADSRSASGIYWVEPKVRAVLPLDGFHLSRSLRKTIARDSFRVTADRAFRSIIGLCAESAEDRRDTWINGSIEDVFCQLHDRGFAHSIEVWSGERLVGGLYGLALGRAFFGESMVSRATDASKVALAWLVARLRVGGFTLLDCQFQTDHLASLGAVEVSRETYNALLGSALGSTLAGLVSGAPEVTGDFRALDRWPPPFSVESETVSGPAAGKDIVQLLGHTS